MCFFFKIDSHNYKTRLINPVYFILHYFQVLYFFSRFQISVARGAHDLSALGGPTIEPGFILAGKMSVLGIETTGAISLLPKEVCFMEDKSQSKRGFAGARVGEERASFHARNPTRLSA